MNTAAKTPPDFTIALAMQEAWQASADFSEVPGYGVFEGIYHNTPLPDTLYCPPDEARRSVTNNEWRIIGQLAGGVAHVDIGRQYDVAASFVFRYFERIEAKLGVTDVRHAQRRAVELGKLGIIAGNRPKPSARRLFALSLVSRGWEGPQLARKIPDFDRHQEYFAKLANFGRNTMGAATTGMAIQMAFGQGWFVPDERLLADLRVARARIH